MTNEQRTTENGNDSLLKSLDLIDDEAIASRRRVFIASTIISNRKERVTQKAVRKLLGGGSFGPIGDYINEWKDERKEDKSLIEAPIPLAIEDKVTLLSSSLWQTAQDEASKQLTIERESLAKAQKRASLAVEDSNDAIKVLEEEALAQSLLIIERDELIADLEKSVKESQENILSANNEIHELQFKVADKDKIEAELSSLKLRFDDLRVENKTLEASKSDLEKALHKANSENESLKSKLADSDKEKMAVISQNAELDKQNESLNENKINLEKENRVLEKSNGSLNLQLNTLQVSLDESIKYSDKNEQQLTAVHKHASACEREAGKLTGILGTVREQNDQLNNRVSELEKMLADKTIISKNIG